MTRPAPTALGRLTNVHAAIAAYTNEVCAGGEQCRVHDEAIAELERLLAYVGEVERKNGELRAALKGVALSGTDETPLWAWCDEGWTCEHPECIRGRDALAPDASARGGEGEGR